MNDTDPQVGTDNPDHSKEPAGSSLHRYESLLQSIDGIVWEADAETLKFIFVNNQAERLLGYPVRQWLTEPDFWVNHIHPDDREWAANYCRECTKNKQDHSFEYRMIAADGRVVWLRDVVTVAVAANGRLRLRGVMVEITDQIETTNALVTSETRLKLLLDQMPAIMWSTDTELRFTGLAGRGLASFEMPEGGLTGVSLSEYFRNDDPAFPAIAAHQGALLGQSSSYELGMAGRVFDCHVEPLRSANGEIAGCVGIALDVTERLEAKDALRRNEELFRAIVEDQTEMIVRWKPDGTRTFVNQAYCRTFGGTPSDFVGTSFYPHILEEYREGIREKVRSLTPGNPVATEMHQSISAGGKICWQEWTDRGIFDAHGTLVELQSTGRDITERKLAEERMGLLHSIVDDVESATDLNSALDVVLRRLCQKTGWVLGQVWLPNEDHTALECCPSWFAAEPGFEEFRDASCSAIIPPGVDIPGRVWTSRQCIWVEEVALDTNFPRLGAAERAGIRSCLGVPVLSSGETVVILEFFVREPLDEDEQFVAFMGTIAVQMGLVIERKRAEGRLHLMSERLQLATKAAQIGIWDWDIKNDKLVWDDATYRLFGMRRENFGGNIEALTDAIVADDRASVTEMLRATLQGEREFEGEFRILLPDGSIRYIEAKSQVFRDDGGAPIRMVGVNYDITRRKLAEHSLRESKAELTEAQRLAKVGSWTWDVATDVITWSDEVYRRRGVDTAETPPKLSDHQSFYTPESWAALRAAVEDSVATGKSYELELEIVRPGGRRAWTVIRSEVIRDAGGNVVKLRGTTQDITEEKLAEERLRLSEERFAKAFRASPDPISIYRHKDGVLLEVNERWVTVYGFTREEAIGRTSLQLRQINPVERERLRDLLSTQHSVRNFEIDLDTKAGEVRHISLSAEQIVINGELCNIFLHSDITEHKRAEERNQKLIHAMGERVKELTALHKTARILQDEDKSIPELLDEIVRTLPHAWQYPEITACRIYLGELELKTSNFKPTKWKQIADFTVAGAPGAIEVVYLEERSEADDGPFLAEERSLIDSLAEMISTALNHRIGQEELRESQRRFSDTLTNLEMIAVMTDTDGIITFCNDYLLRLTGWERAYVIGHNWYEMFIPDEERETVRNLLESMPSYFENNILTRSGEHRLVRWTNTALRSIDGQLIGVAALGDDITERKEIERQLIKSEERYRDLVENALDIIYTHDLAGSYTSINKAGERITGYARDEVLGMNLAQIMDPDSLDRSREMLATKLAGQDETVYDLNIIAKDGRRISIEVSTRLVVQDGKEVGVQGIARDVTERRQLEEQLRQSQRLESVGHLAGGIAHDFNNMLTAINGYSDLTLRQLPADDPLRSHVEEIKKAADRSASLTQQLLAFSRKQVLQLKVFNLNEVVLDMQKMLHTLIGENIDLQTDCASDLGSIKADPGQIEQVVLNLAVNARDAMPRGGDLTIKTENVYLDKETAEQLLAAEGPHVLLSVKDNGSGIDEETCRHIFEPFYTTKELGKGTGLGLATVYGIVKQSRGCIWVDSEVGSGTTFQIYFPLVDEGVQTLERKPERGIALTGTETILLIEDEELVRSLVRDLLKNCGYKVLVAANAAEAFAACKQQGKKPIHLLVADVVMPDKSGPELAGELSGIYPKMKVLYISGYTDDAVMHHGILNSDINFLQKPFTAESLAAKVREVLDKK